MAHLTRSEDGEPLRGSRFFLEARLWLAPFTRLNFVNRATVFLNFRVGWGVLFFVGD